MVFTGVLSYADERESVPRSDFAVILRSLVALASAETYALDGELTVVTDSVFKGEPNSDTQTTKITGVFSDGKITLDNNPIDALGAVSLEDFIKTVDRDMLNNLEVINDFEEDGVRYLDVAVYDFSGIGNVAEELKGDLAGFLADEEDGDIISLLADMLSHLVDSMEISGTEYYRINTSNATVIGIGVELALSAQFNLYDMPVSLKTDGTGFINVIY
jgi:hypothetical protein